MRTFRTSFWMAISNTKFFPMKSSEKLSFTPKRTKTIKDLKESLWNSISQSMMKRRVWWNFVRMKLCSLLTSLSSSRLMKRMIKLPVFKFCSLSTKLLWRQRTQRQKLMLDKSLKFQMSSDEKLRLLLYISDSNYFSSYENSWSGRSIPQEAWMSTCTEVTSARSSNSSSNTVESSCSSTLESSSM